jgi:aspartyl-tRNA(Asn)/glutamyl-tRNA(Gln) amidotransferase subunit B
MEQHILQKYEVVIGLEVHAQLLTQSKAYAPDLNEFGSLPNTNISFITLGHPGTLPKVNRKQFEYAIKMGLACGSQITEYNIFDRKNYFYPDLPKGYQITQDKTPICRGGGVTVRLKDGSEKLIQLTRIHCEEDAGKSIHLAEEVDTLVDFNRAGVPLIEIVSEPDIRSAEEAGAYLTEIRRLLRYLEICDGNMEEGSMRCDLNISVRLYGAEKYGDRVEVKNMNSIRNVQRAIAHETERQIELLEKGIKVESETRMFDAVSGKTYSLRTKETLNDYRYFPEPDLPPVVIDKVWLEAIQTDMPALPQQLYAKFTKEYGLPEYDAGVLTDEKGIALYFEELCKNTNNYKAASNWLMVNVKSYLNELTLSIDRFPIRPQQLAKLIALQDSNQVSSTAASQKVFPALIANPEKDPLQIAQELNLIQDSNSDTIAALVEEVIAKFPDKVDAYKKGKKGLLGLFTGEVMKLSKGKANPKIAQELIEKALEG